MWFSDTSENCGKVFDSGRRRKRKTLAEFIVIDGTGRSILGCDTAIDLKVIRDGPEINAVQEREHAGLFEVLEN